jgi:hypothetical protein
MYFLDYESYTYRDHVYERMISRCANHSSIKKERKKETKKETNTENNKRNK